jgi:hypothetical protein
MSLFSRCDVIELALMYTTDLKLASDLDGFEPSGLGESNVSAQELFLPG